MCGIAGFAGKGSIDDLKKMTTRLAHRGPDAEGFWYDSDNAIYLGHKRLSIIDISGGAQPMWSADGRTGVIYNGEIYNHMELRRELETSGHCFKTDHSDTEILIHGYREWGVDLPSYLNGMWAFAVYDNIQKTIFFSRDRFGKKPLFYTLQNKSFVFASELRALATHSSVESSISSTSLKKYFAYGFIPSPSSFFSNIYKLPAGHNMIFKLNDFSFTVWKYWDFILEPFEYVPKNAEEEWGEQLYDLLQKAVKRRLMSDVPLGVFLSGGIDSSSVTACAASHLAEGKLKTFSIGFDEKSFDESQYANSVASLFNTEHHCEIFSKENLKELLPSIVSMLDEPIGDSSIIPTYLLCREAKKHVTVVLDGDGGDELFAGYDPFRALALAEYYALLVPKPLHHGIRMAMNKLPVFHNNMSLDFKIKRALQGLSYPRQFWNPVWLGALEPKDIEALFQEQIDIENLYSEAIECWESCHQQNLVDKTLQFYTRLYLQNDILVKVDRASMMNSLEVRAPFLDIDVVDFVRKIPHEWKYRRGQTKYILKKALAKVLPKKIIYRSKKGFGVPVGEWFKNGFLSIDLTKKVMGINTSFVNQKIYEHCKGGKDNRQFLWGYWLLSQVSDKYRNWKLF